MRHKVIIPMIMVLGVTGAAQESGSVAAQTRTANEKAKPVQGTGHALPAGDETAARKAMSRDMVRDIQNNPQLLRQKQQFEVMMREVDSDPNLRAQREKMQNDLRLSLGSPEMVMQKSKMEADLKQAELNPERAEQVKRQQRDLEKSRETAPKKAER